VKIHAPHLWWLVLLLLIGVAARETPEIMSLTDDISNEGLVVGYEDPLPKLTLRCRSRPERLRAATPSCSSVGFRKRSSLSPVAGSAENAGKALLHLLSIQRV